MHFYFARVSGDTCDIPGMFKTWPVLFVAEIYTRRQHAQGGSSAEKVNATDWAYVSKRFGSPTCPFVGVFPLVHFVGVPFGSL